MPTVEESFESPHMLVDGARRDFETLKTVEKDFFATKPYREGVDNKSDPEFQLRYMEITKPPPKEFRLGAYRIIGDLRNALDQSVFGASEALGVNDPERAGFPFRESPADLERTFVDKGMCRDVPRELRDTLRSFEPYPRGSEYAGGNDDLRALGYISNPNKHKFSVRVAVDIAGMQILDMAIRGRADIPAPYLDRAENKAIFLKLSKKGPTEFKYRVKFPCYISFGDAPLNRRPICVFLSEMISTVDGIVRRLEADTRAILASRA
jgi:hypothetical protein